MAIIRHTIPVTTNAASNLSTEKKKKFYKYNINFFFSTKIIIMMRLSLIDACTIETALYTQLINVQWQIFHAFSSHDNLTESP